MALFSTSTFFLTLRSYAQCTASVKKVFIFLGGSSASSTAPQAPYFVYSCLSSYALGIGSIPLFGLGQTANLNIEIVVLVIATQHNNILLLCYKNFQIQLSGTRRWEDNQAPGSLAGEPFCYTKTHQQLGPPHSCARPPSCCSIQTFMPIAGFCCLKNTKDIPSEISRAPPRGSQRQSCVSSDDGDYWKGTRKAGQSKVREMQMWKHS